MTRSTACNAIRLAVPLTLMGSLFGAASADEAASSRVVQIGRTPSLVVDGLVDTLELPVSREVLPMLYFTAPVKKASAVGDDDELVGTARVREQNVVMIYPRRRLKPGEVATVRVEASGFDAYFRLREPTAGETVEPAYRVWHRTEQEALRALIDARVETETEERDAERQASHDEEVQREATKAFVRMMREHSNRVPVREKVKTDGGDVVLGVDVATWLKDDIYLLVPVHNTSHRPFKPKAPHVFDERGERYEAELIDPGPYATDASDHEALIPGHTETSVVVHIPDVGGARFDRLRVVFDQADGLPSAWAEVEEGPNPFMRPKSAREVERDRRIQQVAVALRAVTGGFWFSDGTGLGREKAAVMAGVGAHVQKGFGNGLALEAELQVVRTSGSYSANTSSSAPASRTREAQVSSSAVSAASSRAMISGERLPKRWVSNLVTRARSPSSLPARNTSSLLARMPSRRTRSSHSASMRWVSIMNSCVSGSPGSCVGSRRKASRSGSAV